MPRKRVNLSAAFFGSACVRFDLLFAGILTAALFVFSNDQAHAVPDFRDGWVDQGGAWHPWPNNSGSDSAGQPPGGSSDNPSVNDNFSVGDGIGDSGGVENGNASEPQTGGGSDTDLAGLNTIFNDLPLDNGPPGGSTGGTQSGEAGGSSVDPGGSRQAVPEPSSIALLTGALVAAGAARRRKPAK